MSVKLAGYTVPAALYDTGCSVPAIISKELYDQLQRAGAVGALSPPLHTISTASASSAAELKVLGSMQVPIANTKGISAGAISVDVVAGLRHLAIIGMPFISRGRLALFRRNDRAKFIVLHDDVRVGFGVRVWRPPDEQAAPPTVATLRWLSSAGVAGDAPLQDAITAELQPERLQSKDGRIQQYAADEHDQIEAESAGVDQRFMSASLDEARAVIDALPCPGHVDAAVWASFQATLKTYADIMVWRVRDPDEQAALTGDHRIDLLPDSTTFNQAPYQSSERSRAAVRAEVEKLRKDGIVGPSVSPYSSAIFTQTKKDGSARMLVDMRNLNERTRRDVYPLPRIDYILDRLRKAKFITTMDLKSGYFQIPIHKAHRHLTAFRYDGGLAEFLFMAQGLCNAPSTFQRIMDRVLADYKYDFCFAYLDDIIVFSETLDEHVEHVRQVLDRLRAHNLTLSIGKCVFAQREVKFLGHIVADGTVRPDPAKTEALRDLLPPRNHSQCRSFLGLVNYYRAFVPGFAETARPLHKLASTHQPFEMTRDALNAFHELVRALQQPPVLRCSDPTRPFFLYTDASDVALGAVLAQKDDDGNDYPIAYISRGLNDAETRYTVTERECLAIVWATRKFHEYVADRDFTVYTDHSALKWLFNLEKLPTARLIRWVLSLQAYTFTVVHRPGIKHQNADALSRLPRLSAVPPPLATQQHADVNVIAGERLLAAQATDTELEAIHAVLLDSNAPGLNATARRVAQRAVSKHQLTLREGVIVVEDTVPRPDAPPRCVPFIPRSMRNDVLSSVHDEDINGHPGERAMYYLVRDLAYWPRLAQDVKAYVRLCSVCQRSKPPRLSRIIPSVPMPIPKLPFSIIGMDACQMPLSEQGNNTVIAFTDYLTKWVEAVPVHCQHAGSPTGEQVARAFVSDVLSRHGMPEHFVSDRGKAFCEGVMRDVVSMFGARQRLTSSHHPQANGLTERFNGVFINMLRTYSDDGDDARWDERLPFVLFAYRCHSNRSLRRSPFFLRYGHMPSTPGAMVADVRDDAFNESDDWLAAIVATMPRIWQRVQERLEEAATIVRSRNEQLLRDGQLLTYSVGDVVRVRVFDDLNKLSQRWSGLHVVTRLIGPATVELAKEADPTDTVIAWTGNIRPALDRQ